MRNIKQKVIIISLLSLVFCAEIFATLKVNAAGGAAAGNGGGVNGGSCAPDGKTKWNDTCFGYTWRKGTVTGDSMHFSGTSHVAGGDLNGCVSVGATEYFRLGMEYYNPTKYKETGDANAASLGSHVGAILPSVAAGKIRTDISGTYSEGEVQSAFYIAAKLDADGNDLTINGQSYDQTPSFCWNPDWASCPPDDPYYPTCAPPPSTGSAMAYFESTSTINVGNNIDNGGADITTTADGYRDVEFSTDNDYTTVTFKHDIHYKHNTFTLGTGDQFTTSTTAGDTNAGSGITDVSDTTNIYTPFYITNTENGSSSTSATTNTSKYSTSDGTYSAYNNSSYSIYVPEGSQKTVCSSVTYTQKNAILGKSKHITTHAAAAVPGTPPVYNPITGALMIPGTSGSAAVTEVSHYDYYLNSYSGTGGSEVCVTIVHPRKPGGNPKNPNASGAPVANLMFAGEDTRLSWDINAQGVSSRRLQERSIIGYLVPASTPYSSGIHTGSYGTGTNPCAHYGPLSSLCHDFSSEAKSWSDAEVTDTYSQELQVKVPNEVGYKYCNSAGYKFQYYFAIDGSWQADSRPGKTYWFNFGASCRTIAKKPTAAIWNGGIFTSGGIKASVADRFNTIGFGETTGEGDIARKVYGSWSEFLTVAGKGIRNGATEFASGSVFYDGTSKKYNSPDGGFYPLTITNTNRDNPGNSDIGYNTTLTTRLDAYLRDKANPSLTSNVIGGAGWTGVNGTIIYSHTGNVTISGNITTNPGPYTSIYDIPQVIIFVKNGDIEITDNVTQIDAWIIATGKINTCSSFNTPGTQTNPSGSSSSTAPITCDKQLIFNGPVMADKLVLNRSFGSDPNSGTGTPSVTLSSKSAPAEIFNFRADAYLWAYAQSSRYRSSFTESYSRELAPRY